MLATSWMAIITPTDRPKSVRNRFVVEVFGGIFVLSRCFLVFSVGVGFFCHRNESDLFLFHVKNHISPGDKLCHLFSISCIFFFHFSQQHITFFYVNGIQRSFIK